jgi:hypothetical protein
VFYILLTGIVSGSNLYWTRVAVYGVRNCIDGIITLDIYVRQVIKFSPVMTLIVKMNHTF